MMNKLFSANGKLETVQTTASHLYNMIGDAKKIVQYSFIQIKTRFLHYYRSLSIM